VILWAAFSQFLSIPIAKANAVAPTGDTSPLFFIELGKKRPIKPQKEIAFGKMEVPPAITKGAISFVHPIERGPT